MTSCYLMEKELSEVDYLNHLFSGEEDECSRKSFRECIADVVFVLKKGWKKEYVVSESTLKTICRKITQQFKRKFKLLHSWLTKFSVLCKNL